MRSWGPNEEVPEDRQLAALQEARRALDELLIAELRQKGDELVRIIHAVEFEGPASQVADQLARSMGEGERVFGSITIRVANEIRSTTRASANTGDTE